MKNQNDAIRNQISDFDNRGVATGGPWVPVTPPPPVGLLLSKQPTIFRWRKRHDNILAVKAIVEKPTFFKICFFVKYFLQRLLSLVNMGLHAPIIRLSPLIHEGEQRYKPYIVGDLRMVSLLWPPPLKNPFYAPGQATYLSTKKTISKLAMNNRRLLIAAVFHFVHPVVKDSWKDHKLTQNSGSLPVKVNKFQDAA